MAQSENLRAIALDMLLEILEKGAYSTSIVNGVLDKYSYLPLRERNFLVRLTRGTVEKVPELDDLLNQVSSVKVRKMKPVIREILRMSIYQLRYMDHVPPSAVVNEAVKLAKKRKFGSLSGFVNGVLRGYERAMASEHPLQPRTPEAKYSMPGWIIDLWNRDYGEAETEKILRGSQKQADLTIRTNLLQTTPEALKQNLETRGLKLQPVDLRSIIEDETSGEGAAEEKTAETDRRENDRGVYILSGVENLTELPEFQKGQFYIQDLSSMLPAELAEPKPGMEIIDLCAAPGGKSIDAALLMGDQGHILARDLTGEKTDRIRENADRLHISCIEPEVWDASVSDPERAGTADIVFADLPCSGLGVLRRKPEIKYRLKPEDLTGLQSLQRKILKASAPYVKPGGRLVYSTCTLDRAENQENRDWILREFPELHLTEERQILPGRQQDGFYIAVFDRSVEK